MSIIILNGPPPTSPPPSPAPSGPNTTDAAVATQTPPAPPAPDFVGKEFTGPHAYDEAIVWLVEQKVAASQG